mgnify:CR=1 FL=1
MINFGPATITWESTNQLVNGDFELWSSGNNANNWTGEVGLISRNNNTVYSNISSACLTSNGTAEARYAQNIHDVKGIAYWRNKTVTLYGYVLSSNNNNIARLGIYDNNSETYSNYYTGNNNWQYLSVSKNIAANAECVRARIRAATGNYNAYYDKLFLVEGPYTLGKTFGGGSLQLYYHNSIGMYTKNLSSLIYGGEGVLHMFQWNNTFSFNNNSPMLYDYGKLTIACNNITYTIDCAKLFLAPSYSFGTFTQHPIDIHFSFKKSPDTGNYITIS